MKISLWVARTILCVATVAAGSTAYADDRPEEPSGKVALEEGRARFKRGVELFGEGDYRAALIEFRRADEVAPNPKISFNIAQTCLELQEYACALNAFDRYLREAGQIPKERRGLAERELRRMKTLVGHVRVTSNADGARVTLDDADIGQTPLPEALLLGAGRHKITISLSGRIAETRLVDVAGGDALDVAVELSEPAPAPVTQPPPVVAAPEHRTAEPLHSHRTPFWVAAGTTGVLAAATAVTGVVALSAKSQLDATANRFGATPDDLHGAQTKVRAFSTATDVLAVSAAVAATVTVVLFFTTSSASRSASRRPPSRLDGVF